MQTAEQARARALADFTQLDMSAPGVSPRLLEQRRAIYSELSSRRQRIESLLETSAPTAPRITAIRADVATLRQRLNDIDAQLAAASIRTSVADNRIDDRHAGHPERCCHRRVLARTQARAGMDRNPRGVALSDLGSSAAINDAALALHTSLRSLGSVSIEERLRHTQRVYELVMAPVQSQLADKRSLTVVADGALHYVPFGVLRSAGREGRFVIENHDVAVAPSARTLLLLQPLPDPRATSASRMLLVADPVYRKDDARLAMNDAGTKVAQARAPIHVPDAFRGPDAGTLQRLPGTAAEAAAIRALFTKSELDALEGPAASRDRFLATDFRDYRFIHVATHAVADSEIPQLSALILSTVDEKGAAINGRVFAADLLTIRLNTELLVLSGCETALGKSVAGEGLIGLQYIMLARGARSVMSSLWAVPDRETADLMSRFYSDLLLRGQSPRHALGNAMRTLLAGGTDPGIWSAFALTTSELSDR